MAISEKVSVEIEIPAGVEINIEGALITVKGPKGSLNREFSYPGVKVEHKKGKVVISVSNKKRALKAVKGTFAAHIRNMINGVTQGFEYKLKVVYSHFPITVKHLGDVITIDNFLGEKTPRRCRVFGDCSISIKGEAIEVSGISVEEVAQTAANIELSTKVKGRDRRVFQDGIYLVSKGVAG
jgi:large subunit ribosomal protein L6